jgi:hypothetical protein
MLKQASRHSNEILSKKDIAISIDRLGEGDLDKSLIGVVDEHTLVRS